MSNALIYLALIGLSAAYGVVAHRWWLFWLFVIPAIILIVLEIAALFRKGSNGGIPVDLPYGLKWSGNPQVPQQNRSLPDPHIQPNELNRSTYHSNGWTWKPSLGAWQNDRTGEVGWYE